MKRPSAPLAISLAALFFSLTGASLAASSYIITSTHQIKPNVLRTLRGRSGPPGSSGQQGATGPAGIPQLTIAQSSDVIAGGPGFAQVLCPGQLVAISGGFEQPGPSVGGLIVDSSYPLPGGIGWYIDARTTDGNAHTLNAYAVCTTATT
jgi:hypothetical protein